MKLPRNTPSTGKGLYLFVPASIILGGALVMSVYFFMHSAEAMKEHLRSHLGSVTTVSVARFNANDIAAIRSPKDEEEVEFFRVVLILQDIRRSSNIADHAYIMRPTSDPDVLEYVVDADSEPDMVMHEHLSAHGIFHPGDRYELDGASLVPPPMTSEHAHGIYSSPNPAVVLTEHDPEGRTYLSAFAPIKDDQGEIVAYLRLDMGAEQFLKTSRSIFSPFTFLLILLIGVCCASILEFFLWQRHVSIRNEFSESKSNFLSAASHQLRSPLTGLLWAQEILQSGTVGTLTPEQIELLETASSCGRQMSDTISVMRYIATLQAGEMRLEASVVDVESVFKDIIQQKKWEYDQKKQTIAIECSPGLTINSDGRILKEVLYQLATNAIHYTPTYGKIILRAKHEGEDVLIEVQDNGYGIAQEEQPRIFEKFFRGSRAFTTDRGGSGLGLYLVSMFVELIGGEITFRSEEDKGSTFTLRIRGGKAVGAPGKVQQEKKPETGVLAIRA